MVFWDIRVLYYGEIAIPKALATPGLDPDILLHSPYLGFLLQSGSHHVLVDTGISDNAIVDGKAALTEFEALSYDPAANASKVAVRIKTGRLHQIRRHFDLIGHPVMGDPRYGAGNKNKKGLQLVADRLSFICPFAKREMVFAAGDGAEKIV